VPVAFIEPPQVDVIEKIMRHCGLWHPHTPRPPLDVSPQSTTDHRPPTTHAAESEERTYVDMDTFWATF